MLGFHPLEYPRVGRIFADKGFAITVPIFSIVAVPRVDRVSPVLKQTHAKLAVRTHRDAVD